MKNINIYFNQVDRLRVIVLSLFCFFVINNSLKAGVEKQAAIRLSFDQNDSMKICKAIVTSEGKPVKETDVHFYVQRMYSLLPIGKAVQTDSAGEAVANFPLDLPGDKNGNLIVVVKIEDDDNFGNVEERSEVKWGIPPSNENDNWSDRSLSASRDKAPMLLIFVSNTIIALIWGTIFYVVYQVYRIRKESQMLKSKNK